jgi:hypothetical protein
MQVRPERDVATLARKAAAAVGGSMRLRGGRE